MVEPLAVIGLVAAIVQFIDFGTRVVHRLQEFDSKAKETPEVFRDICIQLPLLIKDLKQTKDNIETGKYDQDSRKSVLAVIQGCQAQIQTLDDVLTKTMPGPSDSSWQSGKKAILSLYKDETVRRIAEKLRDNIIYLTHHSIVEKTQNDRIRSVQSQDDEILRMLHWLSPFDPSTNHIRALQQREPDTGRWLLNSTEFNHWKTSSPGLAWLYGIPGCGKTVLCSTIIQHIQNYCQGSTSATIAYYYFDFNDKSSMTINSFLRSIIRQICAREVELPEAVQMFCSQHRASGQQPSPQSLVELLQTVIDTLKKRSFIIIDALDEYPETSREDLVRTLKLLTVHRNANIHILVTSRNEQDIRHALGKISTSICMEGSIVDDDIRMHVRTCLAEDAKLCRLPESIKHEIESRLSEDARGMFRWAVCQLDTLRLCRKPSAIKAALKELPRTLDDTYERILQKIDCNDFEDAQSILKWLTFAERPLTLDEVAEAAVTKPTGDVVDVDDKLVDLSDVLHICRGLITLSEEQLVICGIAQNCQVVRFAHFSVKEYLTSKRIAEGPASGFSLSACLAHDQISRCCLSVVLQNNKKNSQVLDPTVLPLLRYAAEYWFVHVKKSSFPNDNIEAIASLIASLFGGSVTTFRNWLSIYDVNLRRGNVRFYRWRPHGFGISPLYYASLLGLLQPARFLLDRGMNVNALGGKYGNAVVAACTCGSEEMVNLLLDRGADVNAHSGLVYGHALQAACFCGFEPIVRVLLRRGAKVNARNNRNDTALEAACEGGHESIVRLLLESGADINAHVGGYGSALQAASERGHHSVVSLLIEKGADVNVKGGHYGHSLQAAAAGGQISIVELLLDAGADVNAQGGGFRDALRAASTRNHAPIVKLLLARGADVQPIIDRLRFGGEADDEALSHALEGAQAGSIDSLVRLLRIAALRIVQINSKELEARRLDPSKRKRMNLSVLSKAVSFAINEDLSRHDDEFIFREGSSPSRAGDLKSTSDEAEWLTVATTGAADTYDRYVDEFFAK